MSRIKIRNFGPLKETVSAMDGWIDIEKVTVFTGNQGSGKSTVAKLVSMNNHAFCTFISFSGFRPLCVRRLD